MLFLSILLYVSTKSAAEADSSSTSSLERSVEFECPRIPTIYCCTTRVRLSCPDQCFDVRCDPDFYERVLVNTTPGILIESPVHFSLLKSGAPSTSHPALSNASSITGGRNPESELVHLAVGPRTIYKNGLNDGDTADSHNGVQTVRITLPPIGSSTFATLIHTRATTTAATTKTTTAFPLPPSHAVLPSAFIFSFTSTSTASEQTSPKPLTHGYRNENFIPAPTNSDGSQPLVSITNSEDYYETVAEVVSVPPVAVPISPVSTVPSFSAATSVPSATIPGPQPLVIAGRQPQTFVPAHVETSSSGGGRWELRSLKVVRHVTPPPNWPYTGHLTDSENSLAPQWNVGLEKGINALLGAYFGTRRPGPRRRKIPTRQSRIMYTTPYPSFAPWQGQSFSSFGVTNVPSSVPFHANISRNQLLWTTPIPPVITNAITAQCGVAPDFLPCIPISQANFRFVQCCRNKLLPIGCQNLCRYDVTQAEIKAALDAGLCGILHVAPIVECASDGRDNSECCRYKQVTAKSAPQCEVFCRSGQEIKGLGLQHLICRKVMNELIACHLSGLKV